MHEHDSARGRVGAREPASGGRRAIGSTGGGSEEPRRNEWSRHRRFWRGATRFSLTQGVDELPHELRRRATRLAVLSNAAFSGRALRWQLDQVGLLDLFEFVMASGDYVLRKPHPAIFRAAAGKLDLPPEAIWYLGDSARYDVAGAISAGMTSVWYNPAKAAPPAGIRPDMSLSSWAELLPLLESAAT